MAIIIFIASQIINKCFHLVTDSSGLKKKRSNLIVYVFRHYLTFELFGSGLSSIFFQSACFHLCFNQLVVEKKIAWNKFLALLINMMQKVKPPWNRNVRK